MELIDPELQEDIHSSKSSLTATTDLVEGAHRSISTTDQDHMEGIVAEPLSSDREVANQPVAIAAEEDVWEAEMLLAKWTKGRTTWYLVKWKGFDNSFNVGETEGHRYRANQRV